MKIGNSDKTFMGIAIGLARKGMGKTSPNPAVGAVLVKKGKVIASAYHRRAGEMHAEAAAIKKAGKAARGATLYGTLEACAHYGKTPPCVDAIMESGVKRAVFAMKDPNPLNRGRGIKKLKQAKIKTECGVLEKESAALNKPFIKFMASRMPYVTLKMAQSLDGKIADARGRSKWISSEDSREFVHRLRSQNDAVLIGVNTLLKDDPLLTDRATKNKRQPARIIIDTDLRTPLTARIFKNSGFDGGRILIIGGKGAPRKKKTLLEKKGAEVILLPERKKRVDLRALMKHLAKMNISSVLCEGGGEISASLLNEGLVDEVLFFVAPRIIGGRTSPTSCDGSGSDIEGSIRLKAIGVKRIGRDILIRGEI